MIVPSSDQPAVGQVLPLMRQSSSVLHGRGSLNRVPIQWKTGTLTALPTSFQRDPRRLVSSIAGAVQSLGNPCRRSASRISGVTIRAVDARDVGITIAGGEGIPKPEPPFNVGTAFRAQPSPRVPSVQ